MVPPRHAVHAVVVVLVVLNGIAAASVPARAEEPEPRHRVLIELFTSQG